MHKATCSEKPSSVGMLLGKAKMCTVQEHAETNSIHTATRTDRFAVGLTRECKWAIDGLAVLGLYQLLMVTMWKTLLWTDLA